jgi:hypothetical protein
MDGRNAISNSGSSNCDMPCPVLFSCPVMQHYLDPNPNSKLDKEEDLDIWKMEEEIIYGNET